MFIIMFSLYQLLHTSIPFLHFNIFMIITEAHTITKVTAAPITPPIIAVDIVNSVKKNNRKIVCRYKFGLIIQICLCIR